MKFPAPVRLIEINNWLARNLEVQMRLFALRCALLAGLAAVTLSGQAQAADTNGRYVVRGLGSATCQTYLAGLKDPIVAPRYLSWLLGYETAAIQAAPQTFDIMPTNGAMDFANVVTLLCKSTPKQTLVDAATQAVLTLRPLRQVTETPMVTFVFQNRSVQLRQGAAQQLAVALAAKKLYRGETSGQPNADFYKAIKALQEREKLTVTGLPDIDTFIRAIIKQ